MKKAFLFYTVIAMLAIKTKAQTVTDIEGTVYNTAVIGGKEWMTENLKVQSDYNGIPIAIVSDQTTWQNNYYAQNQVPAWCYPDGDALNNGTYGKLYNWYMAAYVCPVGWHLPTYAEYQSLSTFLGGDLVSGGKLKSTSLLWNAPNTDATNSSGFSALPAGSRDNLGYYTNGGTPTVGNAANFWTASEQSAFVGYVASLSFASAIFFPSQATYKEMGASIRCVNNVLPTQIHENNQRMPVRLYPNPANDRINVEYSVNEVLHVQIFDPVGQLVLQCSLTVGNNEIDISDLSKGIYIVQITCTNWTRQTKITKE